MTEIPLVPDTYPSTALLNQVNTTYTALTQALADAFGEDRKGKMSNTAKRAIANALEEYTTPAQALMANYRVLLKDAEAQFTANKAVVDVLNDLAALDGEALSCLLEGSTSLSEAAAAKLVDDSRVILASDESLTVLGLLNTVLEAGGLRPVTMVSKGVGAGATVSFE